MSTHNRLVSTFLDLVKIDSPSGFEKEISDYLKEYFKKKQIDFFQDEINNILVKITGSGEPLFLSAHIDTVEPGKGIQPVVEGDVIKSNGSTILGADNKSTVAVLLELIERLQEEEIPHRPLEILFTIDEENTSLGARKFDYSLIIAKKGIISDISQPLGSVVIASPAYTQFNVTLTGEAGHAAYPEEAKNVLDALAEVISMKKGRLDEETTLNIGIIESGTARNTIPGKATVKGEIRSYSQDLLDKHTNDTVLFIEGIAKKHGVAVDINHKQDNLGYSFAESDKFVQEIASTLENCGLEPRFIKSPSVSDGNEFNAHGLQVVNIGDGSVKTHTVGEHIKITDMEKLLDIFMKFATYKE